MTDLSALSLNPSLLAGQTPAISAAEMAKRGDIKSTAEKFEASFLSIMMQQMFAGVQTAAPFGGGPGEDMFKSFLTEAMAKQVAKTGSIGIAKTVGAEMLKLQGLKV